MKKSIYTVFITLICVLSVVACVTLLTQTNNVFGRPNKEFSLASSVNENIVEGMSRNQIATMYVNSCVSVYVETTM